MQRLPHFLGPSLLYLGRALCGGWVGWRFVGVDNRDGFGAARLLQLTRSSKNLDGFGKASDEQGYGLVVM